MHLETEAYAMPTGMLLHEAGKQFAMAEIVRDGWQQVLYERGGWFLLLVHAERTDGVKVQRWQHDETGRITETAECPGPRWTQVPDGVSACDARTLTPKGTDDV